MTARVRPSTEPATPVDHAVVPGLLTAVVVATYLLVAARVQAPLVSVAVIGGAALVAALLERARPERADYVPLDQPLATEVAHYLFNYNLGYGLALAVVALVGLGLDRLAVPVAWPTAAPLPVQVGLAVLLSEGVSYWQHRLCHRWAWLWPFHALHHSGARLNLVRAARFHFVDIGLGSLLFLVPLVALRAPDAVVTWTVVLTGALGVVQHANIRVRSPRVLDRLLCTPAVHRLHHSADLGESDANFGTTIMLFDHLLGTYRPPHGPGPAAVGITDDARPPGFWRQATAPFRRPPAPPSRRGPPPARCGRRPGPRRPARRRPALGAGARALHAWARRSAARPRGTPC